MYNCNSKGIKPSENNKQYLKKYSINHLFTTIGSLKLIIDGQTHDIKRSGSFDNSGEGWYNKFRIVSSCKIFFYSNYFQMKSETKIVEVRYEYVCKCSYIS